ncbi:3-phosphoshikimate 1-carboxyvinyltransferase [Heyndrickxia shackletonii]|uniref:3-phosphoshikimate 1-carboxyvinyltransferase n=1 Tax=Heyndrickxia shackletonii TaxID=157838 RepID=A0A0Q3WX61_9BACI|nr:3-phosphoshikimate 1-carboxyvinyltransferase [Heyndrickxia shackletonii]KQL53711.1 3-phosphoshikimate 1-carboxyvinyltransferase [Heyndrickxia shackletonii]
MEYKELICNQHNLFGTISVPGDKSISHRAIMFGAVSRGETIVRNFLFGADCLSTISCFRKLGVRIEQEQNEIKIYGEGWNGLKEPSSILDVGNSGTTTRLMLGILAGRPFHSVVIGDDSIAKRPMNRVVLPLRKMGATINGREKGNYTPIAIQGGSPLKSITYELPVASAQVKSCLLLAGLQADGETTIIEPTATRDHTERMIQHFGGELSVQNNRITVKGNQQLTGTTIDVPGDISSAAYFMVAAAIMENSEVILKNVGLNPTRTGIIDVLIKMGADITIEKDTNTSFEPVGTVTVRNSTLKGIEISGDLIPRLIDELPIIALLATQADGKTIIKNAEELKVKETNRIDAVAKELSRLGANILPTDDGMIITGKTPLHGETVSSHGDHRIGMMLGIASLICKDKVTLEGYEAIEVSYPNFFEDLQSLIK